MYCEYCGGHCQCAVSNPPCGFCTSHIYCELCGKLVCESIAEELVDKSDGSSIMVCPECADACI